MSSSHFLLVHLARLSFFQGFNNTGNVCVWPSEEILAHFSLKNLDSFRGLRVCELGGGMTSLAGLFVAKYAESVQQVLLTDGNAKSVRNLEAIAERSARRSDFATLPVVRRLRWGEAEDFGDLIGTFDVLLVSDCFYFDESRQSLADTVDRLLSPTGFLLAFAPSRHGTLEKFAALMVSRGFHVFMTTHYDPEVSRRADQLRLTPQFNPDLHHPILLRISRADCRPLHFD